MNTIVYAYNALLISVSHLALGLFVLLKNPRSKVSQAFFLICLTITGWSFGLYKHTLSEFYDQAYFWDKFLHLCSIYIPWSFIYFSLYFVGQKKKTYLWVVDTLNIGIFVLFLLRSNFFITETTDKPHFNFFPTAEIGYFVYYGVFLLNLFCSIQILINSYLKSASSLHKEQIKYFLTGMLLGFGGATTNFLAVFFKNIFPIGCYSVPFFAFMIGYAVVKHHLMGVDLFIKRGLVYLGLLTALIIPTYLLILLFQNIIFQKVEIVFSLATLCVLLAFAYSFYKLNQLVEPKILQMSAGRGYNYEELQKRIHKGISQYANLKELFGYLLKLISDVMFVHRVLLLTKNQDGSFSNVGSVNVDETVSAAGSCFPPPELSEALKRKDKVLIREEILSKIARQPKKLLLEEMDRFEAEVMVPVIQEDNLEGILILGKKAKKNLFNQQDIDVIKYFAGQIGGILNVQSYKEIESLNKELEKTLAELKETQAQLLHSAKLASVGELAAGVAHELNNALNSAGLGNMHLNEMVEKPAADIRVDEFIKEAKEDLQLLSNGMNRAHQVVKNLLTFSKKNSEGLHDQNIHEGIESSLAMLKNELKDRIAIHRDFCGRRKLFCDLSQLNQVFVNLLKNSIDAIKGNGNIWVRTWEDPKLFHISFRDDGAGIPKQSMDRIFDPFFTTKEVGKGTGLGLSVSYNILRNHHGKIECKSEPGKGTEFILSIPVDLKEEADGTGGRKAV